MQPLTEQRRLERVAAAPRRLFPPPPLPPLSALCPALLIQTSCLISLPPTPHPSFSPTPFLHPLSRSPTHPIPTSPLDVLHSHQPDFTGSFKEAVPHASCDSFSPDSCFRFAAPTAELFKSSLSLIEASALSPSSALICPLHERFERIQTDLDSAVLHVRPSLHSCSHPTLRVTPPSAFCYTSDLPSSSYAANT